MPKEQVLVTGWAGFIGSHTAKLLARAHVLAYTHLKAGGPSLAVNVGAGRGTSVTEILAAIARFTGRNVPVEMRDTPRR